MTRVLLPSPTGPSASPTGVVKPAAEPTALTGFTGFSFHNDGATIIRIVVGAAGVGNLTLNFGKTIEGQLPAPKVIPLAASTAYEFGPYSRDHFTQQDGSGLTYFDKSGTVTGDSVGLYSLPQPVSP